MFVVVARNRFTSVVQNAVNRTVPNHKFKILGSLPLSKLK